MPERWAAGLPGAKTLTKATKINEQKIHLVIRKPRSKQLGNVQCFIPEVELQPYD
jgi:hypothetical protein